MGLIDCANLSLISDFWRDQILNQDDLKELTHQKLLDFARFYGITKEYGRIPMTIYFTGETGVCNFTIKRHV